MPEVEVTALTVHYLGTDSWVLAGVSFAQLRGQVTAVIGPSGCGKSTLARTLCGLVPHCMPSEYAGSVSLNDLQVADATVAALANRVAYVGQSPDAAVVTRRVFDDVAFALENLCLPADEIEHRVYRALRQVGLANRTWDSPWALSGGQRQRLAIAAALAMETPLIVLDEPTSTIDPDGRDSFYRLLGEVVAAGTGIVMVDHDIDALLPHADQVLALDHDGRVLTCCTPSHAFGEHCNELANAGVWLPRAIRGEPAPPTLSDFCGPEVQYWAREADGWNQVTSIESKETGPALLEVRDFSVAGRTPQLTMRLGPGDCVGLVGPNGAGKSSLLSGLAGVLDSCAQRALISGRTVKRGRHLAGYVFQNPEHQFVARTVTAEIAAGGANEEQVEELLTRFGLAPLRDKHPLTLSGGQARRLSVATLVAADYQAILLDEPTFGQDWDNANQLMTFIDELRAEGRTVILATHDLAMARDYCTHLVALPLTSNAGALGDQEVPKPPVQARNPYTPLNPFVMFIALLPAMVMAFAVRDVGVNLALMTLASAGIAAARVSPKQVAASIAGMCGIAVLLLLALTFSWSTSTDAASPLHHTGSPLATATAAGALVGLVLWSGASTTPEGLLGALTDTCHVPYRITSAGTAALAFISRFRHDFAVLRTARALRGVGRKFGPLAPLIRWVSSFIPLTILAVQHAERVAMSMETRAFGAYSNRTQWHHYGWRLCDWATAATVWLITVAVWWTVGK